MCENSSDAAKREKSMRIRNRVSHAVGKAVLARHAEEEALMDRVVTSQRSSPASTLMAMAWLVIAKLARAVVARRCAHSCTVSRRAHLFS